MKNGSPPRLMFSLFLTDDETWGSDFQGCTCSQPVVTAGAVIWCRLDDLWGHGGFCQPCINGITSGEFPIFLVLRKTYRLIEYYKKSRLCCTIINFKNSFVICFLLLPQNFQYSHFLIFCYINKLNDNPPKQWFQLGKKKMRHSIAWQTSCQLWPS